VTVTSPVAGAYDHWLKQFAYGYSLTSIGNNLLGAGQIITLAATAPIPGRHPLTIPSNFSVLADIQNQISAAVAGGGVRSDDLLVLSVGLGDILELSEQYLINTPPATATTSYLVGLAKARGQAYMDYVNQLYQNGTFKRIILINPINLRASPYATSGDGTRAGLSGVNGLIDQMTQEFFNGIKSHALASYPRDSGVWTFDASSILLNVNIRTGWTLDLTNPFCATLPAVLETCTNASAPNNFYAGSILPAPLAHQHMGTSLYNQMRSSIGF
jgi:hypothetical protein